MEQLDYHVESPLMVKSFLRQKLGLSARAVIRLKAGGILVNGNPARVVDLLNPGDVLSLIPPRECAREYLPENIPIEVLYEDSGFLAVNKPGYMPMYPVGKHSGGSLLNAVAYHRPGLVFRPMYRLDRNTSGITLMAKSREAAGAQLKKAYLAVCQGCTPKSGDIDLPIGLEPASKIKRVTGHGQSALTSYKTIVCSRGHSLVRLELQTGRTHQIRVHMAAIGFPLAGDDLYGGGVDIISRHALHCFSLKLSSVPYNLSLELSAAVPQDILSAFPELFQGLEGICNI